MDGSCQRPLTGADVIARAEAAGVDRHRAARLADLVDASAEIAGPDELARVAGPVQLGMTAGRWAHVFGPLFGEFE